MDFRLIEQEWKEKFTSLVFSSGEFDNKIIENLFHVKDSNSKNIYEMGVRKLTQTFKYYKGQDIYDALCHYFNLIGFNLNKIEIENAVDSGLFTDKEVFDKAFWFFNRLRRHNSSLSMEDPFYDNLQDLMFFTKIKLVFTGVKIIKASINIYKPFQNQLLKDRIRVLKYKDREYLFSEYKLLDFNPNQVQFLSDTNHFILTNKTINLFEKEFELNFSVTRIIDFEGQKHFYENILEKLRKSNFSNFQQLEKNLLKKKVLIFKAFKKRWIQNDSSTEFCAGIIVHLLLD